MNYALEKPEYIETQQRTKNIIKMSYVLEKPAIYRKKIENKEYG